MTVRLACEFVETGREAVDLGGVVSFPLDLKKIWRFAHMFSNKLRSGLTLHLDFVSIR